MKEYHGSVDGTKQANLDHYLYHDKEMKLVQDCEPVHWGEGTTQNLMISIRDVVRKHSEGIMDNVLVEELRKRGYRDSTMIIHAAGKRLERIGQLRRTEWSDHCWNGNTRSSITRYKYFPVS